MKQLLIIQMQPLKYIVFICLIIASCSSPKSNSEEPEILKIFEIEKTELEFDDFEVIELSSGPNYLLGNKLLTKIYNDEFFILDYGSQKSILHFDKSGHFMNKLGTFGKGPGEYSNPTDLILIKDTLLVLSPQGNETKISKYLKNGEFLSELNIGYHAQFCESTDPGYIIKTGGNTKDLDYLYHLVNDKFEIIKGLLEKSHEVFIPIPGGNLHKQENSIFIHEAFDNKTYKYENESLHETYILDFSNYSIPEEFFTLNMMDGYNLINKNGFATIKSYFENDHYAVFEVFVQKENTPTKIHQIVYAKKKGTFFEHTFDSDSAEEVLLTHLITLTENDELVYMVYPYILKDCPDVILQKVFPDQGYKNIDESANPLIIKCKIKSR